MVKGVPRRLRAKQVRTMLEHMGLVEYCQHYPKQLSGGQQQRVGIARALITKPKILFADEPTGNLDSANADQIMEILLTAVKEQNTTLLMVTHDIQRANYADRVIRIIDGRIA